MQGIEKFENRLSFHDACVTSLVRKIGDLENRTGRNNLLVYKIKKTAAETELQLNKNVFGDIFLESWKWKLKLYKKYFDLERHQG